MHINRLSIGHYSNFSAGTGVTVFVLDEPCLSSYYICGSAPATAEVSCLELGHFVQTIDALVFSGGSAFGLGTVTGVQQWLKEQGRGLPTDAGVVPIVPTACLYDLTEKSADYPRAQDAYTACQALATQAIPLGRVGVATGASVGKLFPQYQTSPGGFGGARLVAPSGVAVSAFVAVNCVGDVLDEKGAILAGAKDNQGHFIDSKKAILNGLATNAAIQPNTTLVAIFIEAQCDRQQLYRICKMATAGLATTLSPCFTSFDGDIIFATSLGGAGADEILVGSLACEAVKQAIMMGVQ